MDAEQNDKLNTIAEELQALRQRIDRIETHVYGRGGGDAASAASDEGGLAHRVIAWMGRHGDNRSSIFYIDRALVVEFCRRVLDPTITSWEAFQWLNACGKGTISKSAAYRFVQKVRRVADALASGQTPEPAQRQPQRADTIDRPAIRQALHQVRRGSSNRIFDLPDELLVEALERAGLHKSEPRRAIQARRWLAGKIGRPVHPNQFHCLHDAVRRTLHPPAPRENGAGASARAPAPNPD